MASSRSLASDGNAVELHVNTRSLNPLDVDVGWHLELVLVSRKVVLHLLRQHLLDLFADLVVDLLHKVLLVVVLLDLLFHEPKGVVDDLPVQLQLKLFPFNAVFLLLDLDGEEVHHVVALSDFLDALLLLVLKASHDVQLVFQVKQLLSRFLFVLGRHLLEVVDLLLLLGQDLLG